MLLKKICGVLAFIVMLFALAACTGDQQPTETTPPEPLERITVEAGTASISAGQFLPAGAEGAASFISMGQLDLRKAGAYAVEISWNEKTYTVTVEVTDTTAPTATTKDVTTLDKLPAPEDFIAQITDFSDVTVAYESQPDMTSNGVKQVTLVLTDAAGNTAKVTAQLTVDLDITAPVIEGVRDLEVYADDTVSYRAGLTITDDRDEFPRLSIDSSNVNLTVPGEYKVIFTATDAAGNSSTAEATVVVKEKLSWYVSMEKIDALVDKVLGKIIKDGMTTRQQVKAIYNYVHSKCSYGSGSIHKDYEQVGYQMLTKLRGDCYGFYAACKLLMDRLEIPNIDVVKVKNNAKDSNHFWSLVSVDGGKTWYHLDATPRVGTGDNFFLVTDKFMDDYSAKHNNCFNRDKSLYPATPKE